MRSPATFLAPGALGAIAALALAVGSPGVAQAAPRYYQCQHGSRSLGFEAYNLKNISSGSACTVVRALVAYIENSKNPPLWKCNGSKTVLQLHSFEGWHLALTPEFVMSKGSASFGVSGTDFMACM